MWLKWPSQDKLGIKCPPTSFCQLLQSTYLTRQAMVYFIFFLLRNISRITLTPWPRPVERPMSLGCSPVANFKIFEGAKGQLWEVQKMTGMISYTWWQKLGQEEKEEGSRERRETTFLRLLDGKHRIALLWNEDKAGNKMEQKWQKFGVFPPASTLCVKK